MKTQKEELIELGKKFRELILSSNLTYKEFAELDHDIKKVIESIQDFDYDPIFEMDEEEKADVAEDYVKDLTVDEMIEFFDTVMLSSKFSKNADKIVKALLSNLTQKQIMDIINLDHSDEYLMMKSDTDRLLEHFIKTFTVDEVKEYVDNALELSFKKIKQLSLQTN